jgi:hypothetical protein
LLLVSTVPSCATGLKLKTKQKIDWKFTRHAKQALKWACISSGCPGMEGAPHHLVISILDSEFSSEFSSEPWNEGDVGAHLPENCQLGNPPRWWRLKNSRIRKAGMKVHRRKNIQHALTNGPSPILRR